MYEGATDPMISIHSHPFLLLRHVFLIVSICYELPDWLSLSKLDAHGVIVLLVSSQYTGDVAVTILKMHDTCDPSIPYSNPFSCNS